MNGAAERDTIAAVATPPGRGGIGVVRVSGPLAGPIAERLTGRLPRPRHATLAEFRDPQGGVLDQGLALYFPGPRSYTGEDVLELQGHGGPVVMDRLLGAVLAWGARLARPGEFTERAFLNGRLDLAQAEAVADLIESGSREAARAAAEALRGALSRRVQGLAEALTAIRVELEAALDFPDEDIGPAAERVLAGRCGSLLRELDRFLTSARTGALLREGMTVVIAGPPNAGKSSLLNALAGRDTAIVSEHPGTTRDLLREHIHLDGLPLHVLDTAGLRESGDPVEREGLRRARRAMEEADRVLLVADDSGPAEPLQWVKALPADTEATLVLNKVDLSGRPPGPVCGLGVEAVAVSARTGAGLDALREHLKSVMGYAAPEAGQFIARRRHLEALGRSRAHLEAARARLQDGAAAELAAEELRLAQRALGEITGEVTSEELLGRIFSSFCIGN